MGSEHKTNDATSFQPSEPVLCANGCGFFGSTATMNLCSKCYREESMKQETAASVKSVMEKSMFAAHTAEPSRSSIPPPSPSTAVVDDKARKRPSDGTPEEITTTNSVAAAVLNPKPKAGHTRCGTCNKKVGLTGFTCRCGFMFCGTHRYPEEHRCTFDFKGLGRDKIAKANPVVKADKVQRF